MLCELCGERRWHHYHHLFPQGTKNGWRRKLYGPLLDDHRNLMLLCAQCHLWKPIPKMSEEEFCEKLNIEVRSKTGRQRKLWQDYGQ